MAEESKSHILQLMQTKETLESEIEALLSYLTAPGGPGLSGGLIDDEGFPINDVEHILSVRTARHSLSCKQTDHKMIMEEIEANLNDYYAVIKQRKEEEKLKIQEQDPEELAVEVTQNIVDSTLEQYQPFCIVKSVLDDSPASKAGLNKGDFICKFGSAIEDLSAISTVVRNSLNISLEVIIERDDKKMILHLTPSQWKGRGTLGCHIVPL
eukprot:TRINITY_DN5495_c2_g1_i3.p2 TRINITY_DN5495_c2_g1~~TRINITY_DN5495_c2_g1_i3.p2  ORF type:complete len:218 (+),score=51.65 TRINITY_DN5495_c2_g1_i3:22-654(+)